MDSELAKIIDQLHDDACKYGLKPQEVAQNVSADIAYNATCVLFDVLVKALEIDDTGNGVVSLHLGTDDEGRIVSRHVDDDDDLGVFFSMTDVNEEYLDNTTMLDTMTVLYTTYLKFYGRVLPVPEEFKLVDKDDIFH